MWALLYVASNNKLCDADNGVRNVFLCHPIKGGRGGTSEHSEPILGRMTAMVIDFGGGEKKGIGIKSMHDWPPHGSNQYLFKIS